MTTQDLAKGAEDVALTEWDRFVIRHRQPGNLAIHFVSFLFFFGSPIAALVFRSWWLLVPFFLSGLVGAAGHYIFDDGGVSVREATSSPQVVMFNVRMVYKVLSGSYGNDIRAALAKVSQ